jgi:hypothetical protein
MNPATRRRTKAEGRSLRIGDIVTRDALGHLAKRPLTIVQLASVFQIHRSEIESAASRKYDAGEKTYDMVTVAAADLAQSDEPSQPPPSSCRRKKRCATTHSHPRTPWQLELLEA